jgi:hypothetical protein
VWDVVRVAGFFVGHAVKSATTCPGECF